jgi:hypothetical protein
MHGYIDVCMHGCADVRVHLHEGQRLILQLTAAAMYLYVCIHACYLPEFETKEVRKMYKDKKRGACGQDQEGEGKRAKSGKEGKEWQRGEMRGLGKGK